MQGYRKLMVKRRDSMNKGSLRHWSPKLRRKVHKYVYRCLGAKYLPLNRALNRKDFARWLYEEFGYGYFYIFSWRMKKPKNSNKAKPTPYRLATISIIETGDTITPSFIDMSRLLRERWFEPKKNWAVKYASPKKQKTLSEAGNRGGVNS